MAIGERIRYFRKLRGMKQKDLGVLLGFEEKSADIRIAQYESGKRTPKTDLIQALAIALDTSVDALNAPEIEDGIGLMHTLFAVEDIYGLSVDSINGKLVLTIDDSERRKNVGLTNMLSNWYAVKEQYKAGEITKEEYDKWRYFYPDEKSAAEMKAEPVEKMPVPKAEKKEIAQPVEKEEPVHTAVEQKEPEKPVAPKTPKSNIDDMVARLRATVDELKKGNF